MFTSSENAPFIPVQVINITYNLIFIKGIFYDVWKIWKRIPASTKTWTQFKIEFEITNKELVKSTQISSAADFHTNNDEVHQNTAEEITNLANAIVADKEPIDVLTAT